MLLLTIPCVPSANNIKASFKQYCNKIGRSNMTTMYKSTDILMAANVFIIHGLMTAALLLMYLIKVPPILAQNLAYTTTS